jgi:pyridoxamine 5'-phosphate oxidase family protein
VSLPKAAQLRRATAVEHSASGRHRGLPTGSMIASSDIGTSTQNGQKNTPRSSHMAAHMAQSATHRPRHSGLPDGRFFGIAITPVTTTLRARWNAARCRRVTAPMSVFTDKELDYLAGQRLARIATVGPDGQPHVVPTSFRYNAEHDAIDVGGLWMSQTKKLRDVRRTGLASIVVDDVLEPWQPRMIEVRGTAAVVPTGGKALSERFEDVIVRIQPTRIISFGVESADTNAYARSVGSS